MTWPKGKPGNRSEWTHCSNGHLLSPDNLVATVLRNQGKRRCKKCREAERKRYRQRKAVEARAAGILQLPNKDRTHCPNGHPYSGENVSHRKGGGRACKACARERAEAKRRAAGIDPREPQRLCKAGHDQAEMARPNGKGCAECHRMAESERRERNIAESRRRAADYHREHRPQVNERVRAWKASSAAQAQRARPTREDAAYAVIIRADPCSYCGGPAGVVDHIIPIARGGLTEWDNLTAACRSCNARKNARSLVVHLAKREIPASA